MSIIYAKSARIMIEPVGVETEIWIKFNCSCGSGLVHYTARASLSSQVNAYVKAQVEKLLQEHEGHDFVLEEYPNRQEGRL